MNMPVFVLSGEPEVADRNGMVVCRYADNLVAMDAEFARKFAELLARVSYKVRFGDYPTPQKTMLSDGLRVRLTTRVALMLRSMQRETPAVDYNVQASRLVDEILKAVT